MRRLKFTHLVRGGEFITNEKGQLDKGFPIGAGDCRTFDFTISKSDYYSIRDIMNFRGREYNSFFNEQRDQYCPPRIFRFEALKIPKNESERKTIGKEQLKRELFWAIADKDALKVEEVLQEGINPNITTDDLRGFPNPCKVPAVIFAASFGGIETVKPFIKAGLNLRNVAFREILLYYMSNILFRFDSYPPINEENKKRMTALQNGVDFLLNNGAEINVKTKYDKTPLMIAAENGDVQTVKTLLEKKVSVNEKDYVERTALFYATIYNYTETTNKIKITELLLVNQANPNLFMRDFGGDCTTPLINAVRNNNPILVKLLLKFNANVNLACPNGVNALKTAQKQKENNNNPNEIIKILEEAGAKE